MQRREEKKARVTVKDEEKQPSSSTNESEGVRVTVVVSETKERAKKGGVAVKDAEPILTCRTASSQWSTMFSAG